MILFNVIYALLLKPIISIKFAFIPFWMSKKVLYHELAQDNDIYLTVPASFQFIGIRGRVSVSLDKIAVMETKYDSFIIHNVNPKEPFKEDDEAEIVGVKEGRLFAKKSKCIWN